MRARLCFPKVFDLDRAGDTLRMCFSQRRAFWRFPLGRARQDKTAVSNHWG
jgi:hypothetical protein